MRRTLGSFETALTLSGDHAPFVVVLVLQLDATPSPERLRGALDALQRRHPPLGVRIVERRGCFAYEPDGTPPIPLEVRPRGGDDAWRETAEAELACPVDRRAGPLLRCLLLSSDAAVDSSQARCELVLTFHHAIMDGASGAALAGELLRLSAPGSEPGLEPSPTGAAAALPAVEALFPRSYRGARGATRRAGFLARQLADELAFRYRRWSAGGGRSPAVSSSARCRVLPLGLSREETSALVRRSRRERVTLTGALHAALLLAVHRRLYGGRPGPLRYLAFADLRAHLSPPPDATALGSCIAMLRYTARVDGSAGPEALWPLARRVSAQIDAGVRRGDRFGAVGFSEPMMRQVLAGRTGRMAATALSYVGPVALAAEGAGPMRVRGLRSFVSNLPEGPQYTAQARLFGGELLLDVVYLEADLDEALARAIAEDLLATLRAEGREVR
jgi:hypothetical protein